MHSKVLHNNPKGDDFSGLVWSRDRLDIQESLRSRIREHIGDLQAMARLLEDRAMSLP